MPVRLQSQSLTQSLSQNFPLSLIDLHNRALPKWPGATKSEAVDTLQAPYISAVKTPGRAAMSDFVEHVGCMAGKAIIPTHTHTRTQRDKHLIHKLGHTNHAKASERR